MPSQVKLRRILPLLILLCAPLLPAQTTPETGGRVVLVLPFDNRTGQTNLAWIGDSFPDTLNQRLSTANFLTISRDDRQFAFDHLGLPVDFKPTRATTIQIAETLDADFVIVGSYTVSNNRIAVQAQVLEVNKLRLSAPLTDSSELNRLYDVENAIAWKVAKQIDPHFNVSQQTFLSASGSVQLSAFENYIRGTGSTGQERIRRLQLAVQTTPDYPAALLALGKAQYQERQYDQAASTLGKISPNDRRALEARFYLGLARFNSAKYTEAEAAFAFVASRLPLPEVVNNQGVASSRQGHDATPLFQRASTADPNDPDYHYNVAVSLYRRGDFPNASARSIRPSNSAPPTPKPPNSAPTSRPAAPPTPSRTSSPSSASAALTPRPPSVRPPSSSTRCAPSTWPPCRPPNRPPSTPS